MGNIYPLGSNSWSSFTSQKFFLHNFLSLLCSQFACSFVGMIIIMIIMTITMIILTRCLSVGLLVSWRWERGTDALASGSTAISIRWQIQIHKYTNTKSQIYKHKRSKVWDNYLNLKLILETPLQGRTQACQTYRNEPLTSQVGVLGNIWRIIIFRLFRATSQLNRLSVGPLTRPVTLRVLEVSV